MFAIILFAFALMQARGVPETVQPAQDQQLLPTILSKTGARVDDFARQVVDLTAHEQISQETLGETGRRKSSAYSYLVLVHRNDLSGSSPEDYRVDAKGNRVAQTACGKGVSHPMGKDVAKKAVKGETDDNARGRAYEGDACGDPQDLRARRVERQAYAKLRSALCDDVSDDAEDADQSQRENNLALEMLLSSYLSKFCR